MVEVKYTLHFEDDTTQDITLGPFADTQEAQITNSVKTNVIAFNANFDSDTANLVLSRYGQKWDGISRVRIITTETYVYF